MISGLVDIAEFTLNFASKLIFPSVNISQNIIFNSDEPPKATKSKPNTCVDLFCIIWFELGCLAILDWKCTFPDVPY